MIETSKVLRPTLLFLIAMLLLNHAAQGTVLQIAAPERVVAGLPLTVSVRLLTNDSFDGFATVNSSACNISEKIFGILKVQFNQNGSEMQYDKDLVMLCPQEGLFSLTLKVFSLQNSLLALASATGTSIHEDTLPPVVLSRLPTGVLASEFINVTIRTDEFSICKLDKNNVTFDQMSIPLSDVDMMHYTVLDLEAGKYRYYIGCMDLVGNQLTPVALDFEVVLPPSAKISLNPSSPIRSGTVQVLLDTSAPLRSSPTLTYDLDSGSAKQVSLAGEKSHWTGYIIIDDTGTEQVGTFHYQGVGLAGDLGTKIKSGQLFLVDTRKPLAPVGLKAQFDKIVYLEWYSPDSDIDHYNIYRKESAGVAETDYLTTSNSVHYSDPDTAGGITYYYRVSAVDKAGNIGPLSEEVSVFVNKQAVSPAPQTALVETPKTPVLDSSLLYRINSTIGQLANVYVDIDFAKKTLSNDESSVVLDLSLESQLDSSRQKLDLYQQQLRDLWYSDISSAELDKQLNNYLEKVDSLKKLSPKSVKLVQSSSYVQLYNPSAFDEVLQSVLVDYDLSSGQLASLKKSNIALQDKLVINSDIRVAEVSYLDDSSQNFTIIEKHISTEGLPADGKIVEYIPKPVAENSAELILLTDGYAIIKQDPIISWNLQGVSAIKYIVKHGVPLDFAKKTSTFVVSLPSQESPPGSVDNTATPTALAVAPTQSAIFTSTETIMIILGIALVLGLAVYYFVISGSSFEEIMAEQHMRSYLRRSRKLEDKAHKFESTINDYLPMQNVNEYIYARGLLKRAYTLLGQKQHEKALMIYSELQNVYQNLADEQKTEIYDDCIRLFEDLQFVQVTK